MPRTHSRLWLAAALFLLGGAAPVLAEREEPSTPEERSRVVHLAHQLEADPLGKDARAAQQWILNWVKDVPDLTVSICDLLALPDGDQYPYTPVLLAQLVASNAAFQIENQDRADDEVAVQGAALKGALRAYGAILKKKPAARLASLDQLDKQMNDGRLDRRMKALVAQRCTAQEDNPNSI
jgi:hypothetical protein